MAYLTVAEARAASRRAWGTRSAAQTEVAKSLKASRTKHFDIFLSHSFD